MATDARVEAAVDVRPDEKGGTVTTVKKNDSDDLDLKTRLAEANEGTEAETPEIKKEDPPTGDGKNDEGKGKKDFFSTLTDDQKKEVEALYKKDRQSRRELREQRDKLAAMEADIEKLKGTKETKQEVVQAPATNDPRPSRPLSLDFDDPKKFAEAEAKYEDDVYAWRARQDARKAREKQIEAENQAVVDKYNADVETYAKENESYMDDIEDADCKLTQTMFTTMLEEGPWLTHWLALNPKESEKIFEMGDTAKARRALARIAAKHEDELEEKSKKKDETPAPAPKKETKKPEPPAPIGGKGSAVPKDRAHMSFKEKEQEYARTHPDALNYAP